MKLNIHVTLDYAFPCPTDVLMQIEAAPLPEQHVESAWIAISPTEHFARVAAQDCIGERIWLRVNDQLTVDYKATVAINRRVADIASLPTVPMHQLPGETVPYLLESRYCASQQFETFVFGEFGQYSGGEQIAAMRDYVHDHFAYVPGVSDSETTAVDSFVKRQGVCRDYAHVMVALSRAAGVPARIASVYALGVDPPDFHAVAEVFLGGEWHLVDATGMAHEGAMAKIGIGRDAADVSFLTAFGQACLRSQSVAVSPAE